MKSLGWILVSVGVLLVIVGAAGYFYLMPQSSGNSEKNTTAVLILGCEKSLLTAPVWIAENKGYFREEGLDVRIKEFDSGKASLAVMLNEGGLDVCTVAQTPIMFHSFKRDDFVIIAAMGQSDKDVKVLVRRDRGIGKPSDLKGKKVGVTMGSTGQFFLDLFLAYGSVNPSDVDTVDIKPSELPEALSGGRVDAICTWEPHAINAKRLLGKDCLVLPSEGIYREDFYFVSDRGYAGGNPEALQRFLKAVERGEQFIKDDTQGAIGLVCERLKLDRSLASLIWEQFNFRLILDQSILRSLEDEARWAIREELVDGKEVPNYLDFVYPDALEKVKPEAITIIR
ncbi:ABC transporter substrate-binding protein [Planctomycetota bacterium]